VAAGLPHSISVRRRDPFFREVSDALIGYRKLREFRGQQELLTASAQGAAHLSNVRYKGGVASYLEILTNETNYFTASLILPKPRPTNSLHSFSSIKPSAAAGNNN
jgi:hypothetical protein